MLLLLLKIACTPLLVAAVTLAARRWGPTIGGLLMGLPVFTGPVLAVLVLDRGIAFGAGATVGIELGVVCVSAFVLAYGLLAAVWRWPASLAGAMAVFFAAAAAVTDPTVQAWIMPGAIAPLWAAAGLAAVSLGAVLAFLPPPRGGGRAQALPWWDIPVRMVTTAAIVTLVVLTADLLGPRLAGVLSTYPIVLSVVAAFTHSSAGADAVRGMLRGASASLVGFVAFFLVVGLTLPALGLTAAYVLAVLTTLSVTAGLLLAHRLRRPRAALSAEVMRERRSF